MFYRGMHGHLRQKPAFLILAVMVDGIAEELVPASRFCQRRAFSAPAGFTAL